MTEVVAALICREHAFMICQRPAHKTRGLLWEFPGGKLEPGETPEQALIRECREELAVTVKPLGLFGEVTHVYPDLTVHLSLYYAAVESGDVQLLEHNDLRYITPEEISHFDFCPADKDFLETLTAYPRASLIRGRLLTMGDEKYRTFQTSLMPSVEASRVIGIPTPVLRKLALELCKPKAPADFLSQLPHVYYEEDNLHGFLLEKSKDYDACVRALDAFLPHVNNWATCDCINPPVFKKHRALLWVHIPFWLQSADIYAVRYGIRMLMAHFLDEDFRPEVLELAANVQSEEYYIRMMVAWFFATALAKQYEATLPYLQQRCLDSWTHRKTIRKAIESRRISDPQKEYLKTLE